MTLLTILSFLACGDSTPAQDTKKKEQTLETRQDKIEVAALFEAFNAKDYYGQKNFEEIWGKLDEEHQLDALEIITKGHRFEVSTDIAPLVEEHKRKIAEKGEDSDNTHMQELAKKSSLDVAQHAFYLRQAIVLWNVAKKSESASIKAAAGTLETELRKSIPHFAQVVRFVDVYSLVPNQDSLPCEDLERYHCELEGVDYDVLRIHVKKGTDPTDIKFDERSLDFLRFTKLHFMIDGQEDVNLSLSPNPVLDFENPKYVEELFDFLSAFGNYKMELDPKTKKYKFIQQK